MFAYPHGVVQESMKKLHLHVSPIVNPVKLSSIMRQFPNLESLDLGGSVVVADLISPTRIVELHIVCPSAMLPARMFPHLETLELIGLLEYLNGTLVELAAHCPRLTKLAISDRTPITSNHCIPQFDNVTFPLLQLFCFDGTFGFNSSLTRFIARHPKLVNLTCSNYVPSFKRTFKTIESDDILWPNLKQLNLTHIIRESYLPRLVWFLENAPRLAVLTIDMGNSKPTGHEGEIARFCPHLKSFKYEGHLSRESMISWTNQGSWSKSLLDVHLNIDFDILHLGSLFDFLNSLSTCRSLCVIIGEVSYKSETLKKAIDSCPGKWKQVADRYVKIVHEMIGLLRHGDYDVSMMVATILEKTLSNQVTEVKAELMPRHRG